MMTELRATNAYLTASQNFELVFCCGFDACKFLQDLIVPSLIKDGVEGLSASFTISPGTPIKPMLAK
jgi:hypothetical protein